MVIRRPKTVRSRATSGVPPFAELPDSVRSEIEVQERQVATALKLALVDILEGSDGGINDFAVELRTIYSADGVRGFQISIQGYDAAAPEKRLLSVNRTINLQNEEGLRVLNHESFELDEKWQNRGLARRVFAMSHVLSDILKLDELHVSADLDVGAYAWLRFGLFPSDVRPVDDAIAKAAAAGEVDKRLAAKWKGMTTAQKRDFVITDEFRALKPAFIGRAVEWDGYANLADDRDYERVFGPRKEQAADEELRNARRFEEAEEGRRGRALSKERVAAHEAAARLDPNSPEGRRARALHLADVRKRDFGPELDDVLFRFAEIPTGDVKQAQRFKADRSAFAQVDEAKEEIRLLAAELAKRTGEKSLAASILPEFDEKGLRGFAFNVGTLDGKIDVSRYVNLREATIKHANFRLSDVYQNQGLADPVFALTRGLADRFGLKHLELDANLDVGGYAWLRRAILPKKSELVRIAREGVRKGILSKGLADRLDAVPESKLRDFVVSDEFRKYKPAFMGSFWRGSANIGDAKVRAAVFRDAEPAPTLAVERKTRADEARAAGRAGEAPPRNASRPVVAGRKPSISERSSYDSIAKALLSQPEEVQRAVVPSSVWERWRREQTASGLRYGNGKPLSKKSLVRKFRAAAVPAAKPPRLPAVLAPKSGLDATLATSGRFSAAEKRSLAAQAEALADVLSESERVESVEVVARRSGKSSVDIDIRAADADGETRLRAVREVRGDSIRLASFSIDDDLVPTAAATSVYESSGRMAVLFGASEAEVDADFVSTGGYSFLRRGVFPSSPAVLDGVIERSELSSSLKEKWRRMSTAEKKRLAVSDGFRPYKAALVDRKDCLPMAACGFRGKAGVKASEARGRLFGPVSPVSTNPAVRAGKIDETKLKAINAALREAAEGLERIPFDIDFSVGPGVDVDDPAVRSALRGTRRETARLVRDLDAGGIPLGKTEVVVARLGGNRIETYLSVKDRDGGLITRAVREAQPGRRQLVLRSTEVAEKYQGRGIYRRTLSFARPWVQAFGLRSIWSPAAADGDAYSLLRSGFWTDDASEFLDAAFRDRKNLLTDAQHKRWARLAKDDRRDFVASDEFKAYKGALVGKTLRGTMTFGGDASRLDEFLAPAREASTSLRERAQRAFDAVDDAEQRVKAEEIKAAVARGRATERRPELDRKPLAFQIADRYVAYGMDIQGVEENLARKASEILERVEMEVAQEIADIDPSGPVRDSVRRARLAALLVQISAYLSDGFSIIQSVAASDLRALSKVETAFAVGGINAAVGVELASTTLTPTQLKTIVSETLLQGAPSSEWWARQQKRTADKFADSLRVGMLQGEGIDQLTSRVRGRYTGRRTYYRTKGGLLRQKPEYVGGVLSGTKREVRALVRTSVQAVSQKTRVETLRENQDVVKGFQWLATLDSRTTEICQKMSGSGWDFNFNPLIGGNSFPGYPPIHWQCRSTTIPILRSWEELAETKRRDVARAADQAAAKARRAVATQAAQGGAVSADLNYQRWLRGLSNRRRREILGDTRAELFESGDIGVCAPPILRK